MGLDNIAYAEMKDGLYIEAPKEPFMETKQVVRGLLGDWNSIRGKRYYWFIQEVANVSLYEDTIKNDVVKDIADKLETFERSKLRYDGLDIRKEELQDLCKWFRICADNGYFIGSWY